MSHLTLKLKIVGKKHQKFKKIILLPLKKYIKSTFIKKIGFIDSRKNRNIRYITLNIFLISFLYQNGLFPKKSVINFLYYFFLGKKLKIYKSYFSQLNIKLFLENEFKKKFSFKRSKKKTF